MSCSEQSKGSVEANAREALRLSARAVDRPRPGRWASAVQILARRVQSQIRSGRGT